jgi:hypothetical protein
MHRLSSRPSRRLVRSGVAALLPALISALISALLVACASAPAGAPAVDDSAWVRSTRVDGLAGPLAWDHKRYGDRKPTDYQATVHAGRPAMRAHSEAGNSTLRAPLALPAGQVPRRLAFSWFLPALNDKADLMDSEADDAVVRVILSFDGDRSRFTARDHLLSELAHLITGEPLPYATLMYVWDHRYPVGTVIPNPHTQRIRKLVVESGPQRLNRWVDFDRDVRADFRAVFGEEPGALTGLGIMSDSNNTGETVQAWFGPLHLQTEGAPVLAGAAPDASAP